MHFDYYPTKEKDKSTANKKKNIQNGFDFRKTRWGMTKEQVEATEQTKPIEQTREILRYRGKSLV